HGDWRLPLPRRYCGAGIRYSRGAQCSPRDPAYSGRQSHPARWRPGCGAGATSHITYRSRCGTASFPPLPLGYLKHLRSAPTHHLRLSLMRQGLKQPVDVFLGLKSYGPNMREVRAPQDTVSANERDHLRTIGIIDQPMIDAGPHIVTRLHLERAEVHAWAETVRVLQPV